uniref:Uncharacterized protein n=1 Tax=Leersia perrieri TaxID=77586 RepID=A0A0D9XYI2_9ORYZ
MNPMCLEFTKPCLTASLQCLRHERSEPLAGINNMCVHREVMEIVTYMEKACCCYVHEVHREFRIYLKAFGMDGIHIWKSCHVYFPKHQTTPYSEFSTLNNLHLKPCYADRSDEGQEVIMMTCLWSIYFIWMLGFFYKSFYRWRRTSFARCTRTQVFPHEEIEDKKEMAQFGLVLADCIVDSKTVQTFLYGVRFGRLTTHRKAIFMAHVMDRDKDTESFGFTAKAKIN